MLPATSPWLVSFSAQAAEIIKISVLKYKSLTQHKLKTDSEVKRKSS